MADEMIEIQKKINEALQKQNDIIKKNQIEMLEKIKKMGEIKMEKPAKPTL